MLFVLLQIFSLLLVSCREGASKNVGGVKEIDISEESGIEETSLEDILVTMIVKLLVAWNIG